VTVPFTVASPVTDASNLVVTVSSNGTVPAGLIASLKVTGTGANRSLVITPATNFPSVVTNINGTSTIALTVSDGTLVSSISFPLTVTFVDQPPTISAVADQTTAANVPFTVKFTVSDVDTSTNNLVVSATVSNAALGSVSVSGTGGAETLVYTPKGLTGTNQVTISASDGTTNTTATFNVVLTSGIAPVISTINPLTVASSASGFTTNVAFKVDSGPLGATNLTVTAAADNTNLVPSVTVTGNGTNFTAAVKVAASQSGSATITVTARNEFGTASTNFVLTVSAVVVPPPTLKLSATGNQLNLTFSGTPNASYEIQSSTDLKVWSHVTTITANAQGAASFTATISASNKTLFFRAKVQ